MESKKNQESTSADSIIAKNTLPSDVFNYNNSKKKVNIILDVDSDDDSVDSDDDSTYEQEDNYSDSDQEGEEATENLIINKARSSVEGPKGLKNSQSNITEMIAIYAGQQQLDNKEKEKLNKKISKLEKELDRLEIQQRYKDLETNNILIERDELKEKKEENEKVVKKTMQDFEKFHKKIKEKESNLEINEAFYKFVILVSSIINAYFYFKSFTYESCEESTKSSYF